MDARKESKRYIFTQNEKLLLLAIVSDYKHIIENKNTNSVTCKQKEDAWLDVTAKFNGSLTDDIVRPDDCSTEKLVPESKARF